MKHIATAALMLSLGVASACAQQMAVKMTFSGASVPGTINLQYPNTKNVEDNWEGDGTLGRFTFHYARAARATPEPSSSCSGPTQMYFSSVVGAGVFRFKDGSLLKVKLTQAGDCIDFAAWVAHCTMNFQIIGGTGRLKDASGTLALIEMALPLLADATNNPVFFTVTGEITGTISGVALEDKPPDQR